MYRSLATPWLRATIPPHSPPRPPQPQPHFYDILPRVLPDWETRNGKLEQKLV